jgi:hypothetical protein
MTDRKGKGSGGGEYVGYRNPPKSGQFVKGRSGNPRGRPRRPKTAAAGVFGESKFDAMILEEMDRQSPFVREKLSKKHLSCAPPPERSG